jgi:multidrug resistance efflux pump
MSQTHQENARTSSKPTEAAKASIPGPVRIRRVRVFLAAVGVLIGGCCLARWAVIPFFFATGVGRLNGDSYMVRASMDGNVESAVDSSVTRVEAGQVVARVSRLVDDAAIQAQVVRCKDQRVRIDRLTTEKARFEAELTRARAVLDDYRTAMVGSLTSSVQEGRAAVAIAELGVRSARTAAVRAEFLWKREAISREEYEHFRAQLAIAESRLLQARAALERFEAELAASRRGIFLTKENPMALQLVMQLELRVLAIAADETEAARRLDVFEADLATARVREDILASAPVRAPVAGRIIRRMILGGQVHHHEPLFEIAGSNVFIEAFVQQSYRGAITLGSRAVIVVPGGPTLRGRVMGFRESAPNEVEPSNLSRVSRGPDQLSVLIEPDDPSDLEALRGQQCRVLFLGREPSWLDRASDWLFTIRWR